MEKIIKLIANILPKRLVYFVVIRAWAKATTGKNSHKLVDSISPSDLLEEFK